jgi:hypothetical protein
MTAGYVVPPARSVGQSGHVGDHNNMAADLSLLTSGNWMTLPVNWYAGPWFTAAAAGFSSPAWIVFDGDSVTNGVNPEGAGYLATGWVDQLRGMLLSKYSASVYGDFYPVWAYSETTGAADPVNEGFPTPSGGTTTFEGGFGSCLTTNTTSSWYQTISTGTIPGWTGGAVTGFDLVYYDFGAGTWEFLIDGGEGSPVPTVTGATWSGSAWVVTNTGGSYTAGNLKKVTVRGLTAGTHTIEYGQVSATSSAMWVGISLFTGNTSGLGFARSAYSGRRAVDSATGATGNGSYAATLSAFPTDRPSLWSGYGPTSGAAQITPTPFGFPTQPTLAFIGYGINDTACGISPDMYAEAIQRKIIAFRRGTAYCNIALVAFAYPDPYNSDNDLAGRGNEYHRYKRVLSALATAYDCAYVDIDAKWGGYPVTQGFMQSGNVHPTYAGATDIATLIEGIL